MNSGLWIIFIICALLFSLMVYPDSWKCPNCGTYNLDTKRCKKCGFKYSLHYPSLWICPQCGAVVKESRVCPKCKYPTDLHYPSLWHCPKCGRLIRNSRTCPYCVRRKNRFRRLHLNILSFVAPTLIFIILIYLIFSHYPEQESNLVIDDGISRISFTDYDLVYNSSRGIMLRSKDGVELFYFYNKAFFADLDNDVFYIYSQLTNSSIHDEYDLYGWHIICYFDGGEYCLAGIKCDQRAYYLLIGSFEVDDFSNVLLSFNCN